MKRLLILLTLCGLAISSLAQKQQGYVKTLGRPNQKGVALSDVTIRVKGVHNTVLSKADGTFSLQIQADPYSLQQVQKTGYVLNDQGIIGRKHAYAANVTLPIVMVSIEQLQTDKLRIENNAYKVAEKNYKAKLELLEKQKEENTIAIEEYRQQIHDLQDKFEKYQSLIDGLADHYAHVDYDDLDEKEREINFCIESGELEKAESLLNQLGIQQRISNIEQQLKAGQSLMDEANADMAAVLKQQEKDAEYLYQLYTIALGKYDNDKARFYIEIRAALDTASIMYNSDAGQFLRQYLSDYTGALHYYNRALTNARNIIDKEPYYVIQCLMNIGLLYAVQFNYSKSIDFYTEAMQMAKQVYGECHPIVERCNQAIATSFVNEDKGFTELALNQYKQSLANLKKFYQNDICHSEIADCYNSMGVLYNNLKKYDKALNMHMMALSIRKRLSGLEASKTEISYHNLAMVHIHMGEWNKAMEYTNLSLAERINHYGENHDMVATECITQGQIYCYKKDFEKALQSYNKASKIISLIHGDIHPKLAHCYSEIGMTYSDQRQYEQALYYFTKSLNINTMLYGDDHLQVGLDKNNIGFTCIKLSQYANGVNTLKKAYEILSKHLPYNSPILREIRIVIGY